MSCTCTHCIPCEYNPWSSVIENHLDCLKKIYQNSPEDFDKYINYDDETGYENGYKLIDCAIDERHLDCAKWLCEIGIKPNEQCILRAIETNNPECLNTILKYYDIDTNGFGYEWENPVKYALEHLDKNMLEILINCGFDFETKHCIENYNFYNSREGLELFKYLYSREYSFGRIQKKFEIIEYYLDYYLDYPFELKFAFDDIFWRNFFFEEDLTNYPLLNSFIIRKKQEIENIKTELETVLVQTSSTICDDVFQYILLSYI